ncbi:MAG: lipase [Leucobacter sp.]
MPSPAKPFVVSLVALVTFSLGAAPAAAVETFESSPVSASVPAVAPPAQSLNTVGSTETLPAIASVLELSDISNPAATFDVDATVAAATSEIGTSRPTGWGQPGECMVAAQRWIQAGGGNWVGGGTPVTNYDNAVRLTLENVQRGDVIQYENIANPDTFVSGVHTILVVDVNDDGTLSIIESNNPGGSGYVSATESWTPQPPEGFQAVVWRF